MINLQYAPGDVRQIVRDAVKRAKEQVKAERPRFGNLEILDEVSVQVAAILNEKWNEARD